MNRQGIPIDMLPHIISVHYFRQFCRAFGLREIIVMLIILICYCATLCAYYFSVIKPLRCKGTTFFRYTQIYLLYSQKNLHFLCRFISLEIVLSPCKRHLYLGKPFRNHRCTTGRRHLFFRQPTPSSWILVHEIH